MAPLQFLNVLTPLIPGGDETQEPICEFILHVDVFNSDCSLLVLCNMHDLQCVWQNLMQQPLGLLIFSTCLLHLSFLLLVHPESRGGSQVQAQLGVEKNDLCGQLGGPERGEGGKGANLQPVAGEAFSRASSISETNYMHI